MKSPSHSLFRTTILRPILSRLIRHLFQVLPYSLSCTLVKNRGGWTNYIPPGHRLIFDAFLNDLKVHIDTHYPIEREMLSGVYDPQTVAVIDRFVKPGDFCLDVGANVGAISLALARRVGLTGKVFAFEPGPELFRRLLRNLELNPALKSVVSALNLGLSDKEGNLFWTEDRHNPGNAGCLGESSGKPVAGTTIDRFFRDHTLHRLDFVKVDVEGMEYEVLQGGLETWKTFRPILYFETLKGFEDYRDLPLFTWIESMLADIGYQLYRVEADGSIRRTNYPDLSVNTLALPLSKASISQAPHAPVNCSGVPQPIDENETGVHSDNRSPFMYAP